MNYKAWFDEKTGIANLKLYDVSTEEDVNGYMTEIDKFFAGKKKHLLLVDLTANPSGVPKRPSREAFKEHSEKMTFDKIAMFGAKPLFRMVAKIAVSNLGMLPVTKFFETEAQAIAWLKGDVK